MELTLCAPRLMTIEKRIAHSPKFFSRLGRPATPPLRIKTVHVRPGQPDPIARPGIFMIHVVELEAGQGQAFTPGAEPGISTAAAESPASTPQLTIPTLPVPVLARPASRRTRAAAKPAPQPKHLPAATAALLREIERLEARKARLERRQGRGLPIERVLQGPVKPGKAPAGKGAGKHRSRPTRERRGT